MHILCVGTGPSVVYRPEVGYHWPLFLISFNSKSSEK